MLIKWSPFVKGSAVHKSVRKNLEKLTLLPLCPHWLNPPCPYGHTINFEKSVVFCTKKCGRPHLKNPPPPPHCGRLFWTSPNFKRNNETSRFTLERYPCINKIFRWSRFFLNSPWLPRNSKNIQNETTKLFSVGNTNINISTNQS